MSFVNPLQPVSKFSDLKYVGGNGKYAFLGLALGAGDLRGQSLYLYRDTVSGAVWVRTEDDFKLRMEHLSPETLLNQNDGVPNFYEAGDVIRFVSHESNLDYRAFRLSRRTPYSVVCTLVQQALDIRAAKNPGLQKAQAITAHLNALGLGYTVNEETFRI